jgi:hypothetical protein
VKRTTTSRRAIRSVLVVLVGCGFVVDARGEEPKATATASKTEVAIGQPFTVDVTVSGPEGAVYSFPPEPGTEQVELRTWRAPASGSPSPLPAGTHRYDAAVFAVGEAEVPAITVGYRLPDGTEGQVTTKPVTLRVVSVLPKDPKEQKLADVRGPVALDVGPAFWVALGMALLAIAGLGWWWLGQRRAAAVPAAPAAPPLSPDAEAMAAFDRLAAAHLVERGDYRAFYIALAGILKLYLERRLAAPVVEMTTAEMIAFLRETPYHAELVSPMRDLSGAADQIKFARGAGLAQEAERHLASARGLVRSLEARLREAEAAARAEAERSAAAKAGREKVA